LTESKNTFAWKVALNEEKILRSFITAFCSKFREPNPAAYNYTYGNKAYLWDNMTAYEKECCFVHHSSNMYSKDELLKQVETNFNNENIQDIMLRYGFYCTEYGIGIFAFWQTSGVVAAIDKMKAYLATLSIPFKNEYSDAGWVFRFKLSLTKESHINILSNFTN
jgi:ABC-type transport system substrate-binding protein